jgi:nitroimidazol reductase NimA-like FMN-containing flavoprotein (pyridoxamine 5'-phosphate oxidase superfamily)
MLDEMKAMARDNNICVLATIAGNKPYCSLMAYVTNQTCTEVYMVTHKQTRKYQNLTKNPAASLMIDSRETVPRAKARALTVEGVFREIRDPAKKETIRHKLLSAYPHLDQLIHHSEAEILRIEIKSFLLLNGLTAASYEKISSF